MYLLGGHGICLKQAQIDTLCSDTLIVVDLMHVGVIALLERKTVLVYDMSAVGKTTVNRALLEAQRRWCPKKWNTVDEQYSVSMTTQDKVATLCDLRLCHGTHLNTAQQTETMEAFGTAYADFARNAWVMDKCRDCHSHHCFVATLCLTLRGNWYVLQSYFNSIRK